MDRTHESVQAALAPPIREAETLGAALEAAADLRPEAPYLTFAPTGETHTVAEVESRADALAGGLSSLGVGKGDRVGIYLENSPTFVAAVFACAKLGAVQVPINWQYREREVRHAFDTAGITACLVEPDHRETLAGVAPDFDTFEHAVLTDGDPGPLADTDLAVHGLEELTSGAPEPPTVEVDREDPFAILYTSGTTGLPKPALLPHRSYLLSGKSFLPALPGGDTNYNPFPLFHGNNQYYSMVGPLLAGTEWLLGRKFTASQFLDHVREFGVTSFNILGGTPKMLLSTYDEFPETSLEVAIGPIGTETWDRFADRFGIDVVQIYSQTESPVLLMNHPDRSKVRKGSIGKPMFPDLGHEATLLDRDGDEVEPGEEGELVRADPGAMLEYFGMPERTTETLRDGRIYSGDIVRADGDGYLYYVDRKKFMIRRSGENIAPREIENVVDELDGVAESAVIPVPDELRGEEVKAMVRRTGEVTERQVVLQVARNLASYKVPRYVEFVDSFPKTPSERIQRVQLAEEEEARDEHGWDREREFPEWSEAV